MPKTRIVFISGGAKGLGLAISKLFLENNDIVYVNYNKSKEEALNLVKQYSNVHLLKGDITKEDVIKKMILEIKNKEGKLDVLINNAGIAIDSLVDDKTKANFSKILDTNLIAPFLIARDFAKIMPKGSTIINIASTNGINTYYPYSLDYDASKAV